MAQVDTALAAQARFALLANFDLEASERRRMIEDELAAGLATLKRQLEREMARLAKGAASHLTAAQFLQVHGASIDNVERHNNEGKVRREMDDIEQDIERTVKKRKRVPNGSPEKINNSDLDAGSPSKPRKNMRTAAPPTPSRTNTASSSHSLGIGRSASRPRLVSAGSRASSSTFINNNAANTSNFIYRARPSAVNPYTINPRLPQTPQFRSGSIFTSSSKTVTAGDGNKTAKRMPRRNESIQAYSMNGSPLGVLDIAVDNKQNGESSSAPPSSDIAEGAPIEADWEVLQPRSSTNTNTSVPFPSLQNTASKSTISPSKLLRKPSAATLNGGGGGGASSTFKAAIVAGASRVKAKTSSSSLNSRIFGHHNNGNSSNSSVGGDFTFQAPSMLSPGKSKTDWENWARSFKAELEGMNMNPEDKRRLERRMMELVQK